MDPTAEQPAPVPPPLPRAGLAVASLVLGITAVCFSFLLFGGVLGMIGLILVVVHLRRRGVPKAMAWWGFSLCVFGLLASIGFGVLYFKAHKKYQAMMESAATGEDWAQWEGVTAPDFTVVTLDGRTNTLSELRGKRVVVSFWATWCPPCRKEIPYFIRLVNETSREELIVIGISSEDEKTLRGFSQKNRMNFPIASADKLPQPYESIQSIPTTFFIDRRGVIQKIAVGYHDFYAIKNHALQKDSEGPAKPQPVAGAAEGSVRQLLEAALTGEKAGPMFSERLLDFNRRTLAEAYQQVGMRDPKWDDLVMQYLENYAQCFSESRTAPSAESLRAAGKEITGLGCKDPLVLYCYGVAQAWCNDVVGAEESLAAAAEGLLKSKYPAIRKRYAATRMAYLVRNYGFKRQSGYESWRTQAIALIARSLQDGSYRDGEQRVFIMQFDPDWDDLFLDKREEVYQAIKAIKGIDPWILKVVEGNYWLARAWEARGTGWANTVTDEGWKGFYAGLAKARTSLTSAWKMHADYPEAAAKMIRVAMGEGDRQKETPRDWFGRAIQAQADYLPAYDHYEFDLFPRWGGSHEAMLSFGSECLATKRFDTAIPYQYYVMLLKVINDIDWTFPGFQEVLKSCI